MTMPSRDQIQEVVELALARLEIPTDPSKANLGHAVQVIYIMETLKIIGEASGILGDVKALELVRATCDCMQLLQDKRK